MIADAEDPPEDTSVVAKSELEARMAASPRLRQLSIRLNALYTWPILLGQLKIEMQ